MSFMLSKRNILKKTLEIGSSTFLSRILGFLREVLLYRYLGAGAILDAFLTAYKIPNSLRKIFAEGALSAAFIPTLINITKDDKMDQTDHLMSLMFIVFEGIILLLCMISIILAPQIINFIAPGFTNIQYQYAIKFLKILMPMIFFLSSSALLAGALQSVNHFFIPAISPALLNIVFIAAILSCWLLPLPVEYLAYFLITGGIFQLILHLITYINLGFGFRSINNESLKALKDILKKFIPIFFAMSVMEINLFLDTSFASLLAKGSISLINLATRIMGIPLGVFAVAFSTTLLPHFSRLGIQSTEKLSFYLFEASKFIFWITIPSIIGMIFFAEKLFLTTVYSKKFTIEQVVEAKNILITLLFGLFFFSLNKILLNIYYSLHVTKLPTIISIISTISNFFMNALLIRYMQSIGLATATSISGIIQTILLLYFLKKNFNFDLNLYNFTKFAIHYSIQLASIFPVFYIIFKTIELIIQKMPIHISILLIDKALFWIWSLPLALLLALSLYWTRKIFKIKIYFLD